MKRIKNILLIIILISGYIFYPTLVSAADKDIVVKLNDAYKNCTFTIDFDDSGSYQASIIGPDDKTYECSVVDDDTMTCTIKNVIAGDWKVHVVNEGLIEIGKFKVSVTSSKTQETDIVDNIKVGKDITGLKIYFKDETLVASWTDDTCGNVNIKIVNIDTSEVISNETIKEKEYSCEIPNLVKNISVTIVPATSANIPGAEISYSYEIDNHPNATVAYPENLYANSETIHVKATMNQKYGIYVEDNGKKVLEQDVMEAGEYDFNVPLCDDGANEIKFYIVDELGNMRSTTATVIKDTIAPDLKLKDNYNKVSTYEDTFDIIGTIKDYDQFLINDEEIIPSTDGTFTYTCNLHVGDNLIEIKASDKAGNESNTNLVITMNEKSYNMYFIIIIILTILICIVLLFVFFKANKGFRIKKADPIGNKKPDDTLEKNKYRKIVKNSMRDVLKKVEKQDEKPEGEDAVTERAVDKKSEDETIEMVKKKDHGRKRKSKKNNRKEIFAADKKQKIDFKGLVNGAVRRVISYVLLLCVIFFVFSFLLISGFVVSESMFPTISTNDLYIGNRLAYIKDESVPERFDVVCFENDQTNNEVYIKRVIGIGGDIIQFSDGYVYVNGEKLDESTYLNSEVETNCTKSFTVPHNSYFVLGDNRENSSDSRYWVNPYIQKEDIVGKYIFTIPVHYVINFFE